MPRRLCRLAADEIAIQSYVAKLSLIEQNHFVALVRTPQPLSHRIQNRNYCHVPTPMRLCERHSRGYELRTGFNRGAQRFQMQWIELASVRRKL